MLILTTKECKALCPKPSATSPLLLWDSWDEEDYVTSLPKYLHTRIPSLRARHAHFVTQLGQSTLFGKTLSDWLSIDGSLSMWWLSLIYERHPKMTPNLYTIYRLLALEEIITNEHCDHIQCVGLSPQDCDVITDFCQRKHIPCTTSHSQTYPLKQSLLRRIYTHLPSLVAVSVRLCAWLWTVKRLLPGKKRLPPLANSATIATYFPNIDEAKAIEGRFVSRYFEELHTLLNAKAQEEGRHFVHWLFIRFPHPKHSLAACKAFAQTFEKNGLDGISFSYLEEFLDAKDIAFCITQYLRLRSQSKRLEKELAPLCQMEGSSINLWPYLRKDYQESFQGWRCLERLLQARACMHFAAHIPPQRFTLFPLENCPWERMLTYAIHTHKKGTVIGAQHSSLRPTDFRYFDDPWIFTPKSPVPSSDSIAANGTSALSQFEKADLPQERLCMVEALRYGYLTKSRKDSRAPANTLLLVTSFFADETQSHMALFCQALQHGLLDGWTCIVKPHPYLDVRPYLPTDLPPNLSFATESLATYLLPPTIVWASNSTTAALEAAIYGLAVCVMQPVGDFDLCPIQDIPGLIRTQSLADIPKLCAAKPLSIPANYLCLDPTLSRWKKLLSL